MLINLHTQDVEQSDVNLVNVESIVLVLAMLSSLEDVHIEAVRIVWTVVASSLDGAVVVSVSTVSGAAKRCYRTESVHRASICSLAGIDGRSYCYIESHIVYVLISSVMNFV